MKNKKIIIIISILITILLIIFGIYKFITSFKMDQEITIKKNGEIQNNYDTFNTSIINFAKKREELYKVLENTYLEDMAKNSNILNSLIADYERTIKNVENNSKNLKENCQVKFTDISTNNRCTTFKANYEAANNYYITDIKSYNKRISKYNDWIKGTNYEPLNKGKLVVYKKYIDFDEDGECFGKEEVNA